jgi:hypothetical protein
MVGSKKNNSKSWLREHKRFVAFVAFLAALSTVAVNVFVLWDRFFPNHVTDPNPQVVNRQNKSDSFFDDSALARRAIRERWLDIKPVLLSDMVGSASVVITTPANKTLWPKIHPWDYRYGVDFKLQGDGDGVTITVWHSCLTPDPKPPGIRLQCSKSPEYRRIHHLHTPGWKG